MTDDVNDFFILVSHYTLNITKISLPLDGARWFAGDVVTDPVDAFDFIADAIGNPGQ